MLQTLITLECSQWNLTPSSFSPSSLPSSTPLLFLQQGIIWPQVASSSSCIQNGSCFYYWLFFKIYFMSLCELECIRVYRVHADVLRGQRGHQILGSWSCNSRLWVAQRECWEPNPRALQEQQALSTPEHLCSLLFCPLQFILLPSHRVKAGLRLTHCAANPPASASQVCNLRCVLQCPITRHFFRRK